MSGSTFGSSSGEITSYLLNTSCLEYDSTKFKFVAAIRAGVGVASLIFCLVVIIVVFSYKRYMFFPHRLVLYLAIAALLHSFSYTISRVNFTGQRSIIDHYCLFAGFIEFYTGWVELLVICLITLNIFSVVVWGRDTSKFEPLLVTLCYCAPISWCLIPYVQLTYGTCGPWCGIRMFNEDCSEHNLGGYLRFFLWHIPLFVGLLTLYIIAAVMIIAKLNKYAKEWEGAHYDPNTYKQKKKLIREFKYLIWYPTVFLILEVPQLISQIYESIRPNHPNAVFWVMEAVTVPLAGVAVAVVFAFDSQTRSLLRRLEVKNMFRACCKLFTTKEEVTVYDIEVDTQYGDSVEGERARRIIYEEQRIAAIDRQSK